MKAGAATAGMLSAAILMSPGCERRGEPKAASADEPLRRAVFLSLVARDHLSSCPGGEARPESRAEAGRFYELRQLALRKGADQAIWLGENDFAAVRSYDERLPCGPGEAPYRAALAAYGGALDAFAGRVAAYRP
jgi:hypothetical protein